jgi:hypothetical protein
VGELAPQIGDGDSTLEASDFDSFEGFDDNQLSEACTPLGGFLCTMLIFTFVDDEAPVGLDSDSGLTSLQDTTLTDFDCNSENLAAEAVATGDLDADTDCSDPVASNGDGVVVFHVLNADTGGASRGDDKTVRVRQEDVEQSLALNIVGSPSDVVLTLTETTIGTSGSVSNSNVCATSVDVTEATAPFNSTLAFATVYDEDDRELTMIPVLISIQPPSDDPSVAQLGIGSAFEDITGDTVFTIAAPDAPIAYYRTVCGGSGTGDTTVEVQIDSDGDLVPDDDTSTVDLTVVGAPASVVLTASPTEIACDGTASSTVTATVTDADGNNVANGTPVNFSVVALGTANRSTRRPPMVLLPRSSRRSPTRAPV